MKTKISISLLVLTVILLCASCEFDNYDEPNVMFTGRLVDGDQVLNTKRGIVFNYFIIELMDLFPWVADGLVYIWIKKGTSRLYYSRDVIKWW